MELIFYTGKLWKEVSGYISQTYEVGELEKIWIHEDGGGWIRNGLEEFAQTRHVMDGFHWERELKRFSRSPMGWGCEMPGKLSVIRIYEKNGGKGSGKDLRGEKEEKEGYGEYAEKILEESIKGAKDWSLFEKEKNWSFDLASGTQQVIHMLGENRRMAPLKRTEAGQLCQEKIPQELDTAHYQ